MVQAKNLYSSSFTNKTPIAIGHILADAADRIEASSIPRKTSTLCRQIHHELGLTGENEIDCAAMAIAQRIDAGELISEKPKYHNRQHTHEVLLGAPYIVKMQEVLTGREYSDKTKSMIVAAGLFHDLKHDGKGNRHTPFRLEKRAFAAVKPVLAEQGVSQRDQDIIHAAILFTDITAKPRPLDLLRKMQDDPLQSGLARQELHPDFPEKLLYLFDNENIGDLLDVAGPLSDMDLMPSSSWTNAHHARNSEKLAIETNGQVKPGIGNSTLCFLDFIDNRLTTEAGNYLQPVRDKLRYTAIQNGQMGRVFENSTDIVLSETLAKTPGIALKATPSGCN